MIGPHPRSASETYKKVLGANPAANVEISESVGDEALGVLTSDDVLPANGATVTIGSTVYTLKADLAAGAAFDVKIGATADATLLSLAKAINADGVAGTDYVAGTTAHPSVTASETIAAHALTITAKTAGSIGNAIALAETSTHLTWDHGTMTGGVDRTWLLFTVTFSLVQGAVQTPQPILQIDDGTDVIFEGFGASAAQAVSTTCRYTFAPGHTLSACVGATTNVHANAPLPAGLMLGPSYHVKTVTLGKGANTDYAAPVFYVAEFR